MQWKSFLAGGAVVAILTSIVTAEQISVPNQFTAGSPARAAEVNANFDVLVQESNAQDERIAALKGDVEKIGNVEQLFCSADPRPSKVVLDDLGDNPGGFPIPAIRFRFDESFASVTESAAICISLSDPATLIESNASQLAADGWRLKRQIEGRVIMRTAPTGSRGGPWYLYERSSEDG